MLTSSGLSDYWPHNNTCDYNNFFHRMYRKDTKRHHIISHRIQYSCINRTFNDNNNNLTLAFFCSIFIHIQYSRNYLQKVNVIFGNKSELQKEKWKMENRVLNQFWNFFSFSIYNETNGMFSNWKLLTLVFNIFISIQASFSWRCCHKANSERECNKEEKIPHANPLNQ